jgi:hypothetical protein
MSIQYKSWILIIDTVSQYYRSSSKEGIYGKELEEGMDTKGYY